MANRYDLVLHGILDRHEERKKGMPEPLGEEDIKDLKDMHSDAIYWQAIRNFHKEGMQDEQLLHIVKEFLE